MPGLFFKIVLTIGLLIALFVFETATLRAQESPEIQDPPGQAQEDSSPIRCLRCSPVPRTTEFGFLGRRISSRSGIPRFHSPYSGPNSLSAEAQGATSRVLTLFTGIRLTGTTEFICDVQETGGNGIGAALGVAGFPNLDVVRNPTFSKAPYVARLMWHQIIPLGRKKVLADRTRFSLF